MDKTKIDWCNSTWNPVTGCLHGCEYCYARSIANRFGGYSAVGDIKTTFNPYMNLPKLDRALVIKRKNGHITGAPYPFGFTPTFHRYRLNDYISKKGRIIFVCSMGDLFGEWVPDEWIIAVFEACKKAPQHNYLFLTKNPNRIPKTSHIYSDVFGQHDDNLWFGTTITCQDDLETHLWPLLQVRGHTFLSIEPLLEDLNMDKIWVKEKTGNVLLSLPQKMAYYFGGGEPYHMPDWIIIGAETGRRKNKVIPVKEWIENIVEDCREAKIPVFMKASLADIWGEPLIQEFPWEAKDG